MSIETKYVHPENHELAWTGRGRQPKWVEFYLANGGTLEQLEVAAQPAADGAGDVIDLGIGDVSTVKAASPIETALAIIEADGSIPAEEVKAEVVSGPVLPSDDVSFAEINQLIGQIQMANSFARFADVVSLQKLAHIKETKAYKASKGITVNLPNGEIADVGTWDGFCRALGMSASKIDEDLINLRAFGEEALENLTRVGAGYRELRQFRKLPADQREALALIATTGTKDDVLEAAYDLIEKERSAAAEVTVKNAELAEDLKLAEKRAKNLDAECERKDSQIKRLSQAKVRTTEFLIRTEEIREEAMALQFGSELHLNSLKKLFEETDPAAPEGMLQQETLWIVANTIAARALDVIEHMKAIGSPDAQPDRPMQRHLLTPDEAVRWLQDFPLIENRFAAEQALRQEKRDAAKPKGPGRPKNSAKNGVEE